MHEMMAANPSNTIGYPGDFSAVAAFLASMQARYTIRQSLLADVVNCCGLLKGRRSPSAFDIRRARRGRSYPLVPA